MTAIHPIARALAYLEEHEVEIEPALYLKARQIAGEKAASLSGINQRYHDAITKALIQYFEGGALAASRNIFKRATLRAFGDAFDLGYTDAGGELPIEDEALDWVEARINQEFGHIGQLFQQARSLRKEREFDYFSWITEHADRYTQTLKSIYNRGKLFGVGNKMLTFSGEDGDPGHVCQSIGGTCVKLMGQRHRASWWIAHDLIPYPGNEAFDCGGWRCQHYLQDDQGERFTL